VFFSSKTRLKVESVNVTCKYRILQRVHEAGVAEWLVEWASKRHV
jgi:hypothetical protein